MNRGADRLAVGSVAEADDLRAALRARRSARRSARARGPAAAACARYRACPFRSKPVPVLEHHRLGPDRQHVLAARLVEPLTQPASATIVVVTEHRRAAEHPSRGPLDQLDPEFRPSS